MKRLLVLLLLVLMPLQLAWAASGICCAPDGKAGAQHGCQQWQQQSQQQCGDDASDAGAAADDESCDCCHHLAGSALVASPPALAVAARYPALRFDPPHYVSHIPDLVPPPDRPSRA